MTKFFENAVSGFTLIELLIVLSIIAGIASFASPNLVSIYYTVKDSYVLSSLTNELYLAKNLAIQKQQRIAYCAAENSAWSGRRIVVNSNMQEEYSFKALPKNYHLMFNNSLHHNHCVIFTPLGFTLEQRGSFYLVSPIKTTRIILNVSGNIRRQ